jgi:ribosome-associated protein
LPAHTAHHAPGNPDGPPPGGIEIAPGVRVPVAALRFAFARSSGPGGQNVNKLETKAELRIGIEDLPISGRAKSRLRQAAGDRIVGSETFTTEDGRSHTRGGDLILTAQEHRSQSQNKTACLEKLRTMLLGAMAEPKIRRKTKPSRGSIERRIEGKKRRSDIKRNRGGGGHD